jgi:hypothetical protein
MCWKSHDLLRPNRKYLAFKKNKFYVLGIKNYPCSRNSGSRVPGYGTDLYHRLIVNDCSVADLDPESSAFLLCCGSAIRCLFDPWIRRFGMGKKSRSRGCDKHSTDHISDSLETMFWVKNTEMVCWLFDPPGS